MSRTRIALILTTLPVVALAWWIHRRNTSPAEVPFAKVRRETLVSTLATNGKAEPSEWVAVRAERAGTVSRVLVEKGQRVAKGTPLVELESRDAAADVASTEAAVVRAKAELGTVKQGGRAAEHVAIDNELERNRLDLRQAQRDRDSLRRLEEKKAATRQDVAEADQKVAQLESAIAALERKRSALVSSADQVTAEARLKEAEAALQQAREKLARGRILSPVAGTVYDLPVHEGAYLNVGDLAASVGDLETLRVRVYVDEPELGRVRAGMSVAITWDALPGRTWKGAVQSMPTQIVALGTRQVGEVICTIENPDRALLPGTNINAEIVTQVVENGLTLPKEAIRKDNNQVGVFVLRGDRVEFQRVKLGASSVTRAAVAEGLREGDLVALNTENPLRSGEQVEPVVR